MNESKEVERIVLRKEAANWRCQNGDVDDYEGLSDGESSGGMDCSCNGSGGCAGRR